jgi:hypothetical protein
MQFVRSVEVYYYRLLVLEVQRWLWSSLFFRCNSCDLLRFTTTDY